MTTPYTLSGQTREDIYTDAIGRLNGISDENWMTAFEDWQRNQSYDEPRVFVWIRVHTASDILPVADISCRLGDDRWLVMAAYRWEPDLDRFNDPGDPEAADDDESRPMAGRAVINIPLPAGWDDHQ